MFLPKKLSGDMRRAIVLWLWGGVAMIFVMAMLGAITRLTQSGLSITDWRPIMGAIPPMNDADWNIAFDQYKKIPQYKILHSWMGLADFKQIYFWEWFHRLWGRVIGIFFAVPLFYFVITRKITARILGKLLLILSLGAAQGFIGWFMVQSGLEVRTSVSPYRLAMHLGFALLLYGLLLWVARDLQNSKNKILPKNGIFLHGMVALCGLSLTILWGAFVAGLDAGMVYNTWPLMDGALYPVGSFSLAPLWHNFFENTGAVQFIHRWLAIITGLVILSWAYRLRFLQTRFALAMGAMVFVQIGLGIATLLLQVPIMLGVLHQAGAMILLALVLLNLHLVKR